MSQDNMHTLLIMIGYVLFIIHILIVRMRFHRLLVLVEKIADELHVLEDEKDKEANCRLIDEIGAYWGFESVRKKT